MLIAHGGDWTASNVINSCVAIAAGVAAIVAVFAAKAAKRTAEAAVTQAQAAVTQAKSSTDQVRATTYPLVLAVDRQAGPVVEFDCADPGATATVRVTVRNDGEGPAFIMKLWFNPTPDDDNACGRPWSKILAVGEEVVLTLEVGAGDTNYSMLREALLNHRWWRFTVDYKGLTGEAVNTRFKLSSDRNGYNVESSEVKWPGQEDWSTMPFSS